MKPSSATNFSAAALFGAAMATASPKAPQLTKTPEQCDERIQWFHDAKFGLFIY